MKSFDTKISIIIPTYNRANLILETISSVKDQTFRDFECLIIDDGSTDKTREILEEITSQDGRFKYFYQNNKGTSSAKNLGLEKCCGQYIQLLDSDDLIEMKKLEVHNNFLDNNPSIDIVYSDVRYFNSKDNNLWKSLDSPDYSWMPRIYEDDYPLEKIICKNIPINTPLFRHSLVKNVGLFDTNRTIHEDWDFWCRCAIYGAKFHFLEAKHSNALVRITEGSISKQDKKIFLKELIKAKSKASERIFDAKIKIVNDESISDHLAHLGLEQLKSGNKLKGANNLLRAAIYSRKLKNKLKNILCSFTALFSIRLAKRFMSFSLNDLRKNTN